MSDIKDKLKHKVVERFWRNEYRLFFHCDDFYYCKDNLVAFTIDKKIFEDKSRNYCNQSYITRNPCDDKDIRHLFKEECIVAIEPENVFKFSFPHTETTLIELTSCYLFSTDEVDFTSNLVMNHSKKLHKLIKEVSGIQDRRNPYVSVLYKITFIDSDEINIISESPRYSNRPHKKIHDTPIEETEFDDNIITSQVKTKKVKKTNFKKKKKRPTIEDEINPDEYFSVPDVFVEPKIIECDSILGIENSHSNHKMNHKIELTYIPKSRDEYFRRAYINSSLCKVVITNDNIYNGSIFTKRVYVLWDNIQISFNMKWYFSSEDMNNIIILLNDLYLKEPRFRIQVNYYKNILITHPLHFDDEGGLIGNHFTGFFADSEGDEKTKTLHFYVVNDSITSITFKEHSQIEEVI